MELEQRIERCLASQEIRERIHKGLILVPNFDENRIQPSSFEPTLGDEVFVLDTKEGLFGSSTCEPVYRTLLRELPLSRRRRHPIEEGYELRTGFTYLLPLQEKISMRGLKSIRASPKSSVGRIFLKTRLIADYNPSFDEIRFTNENLLQMWLVVQPLPFNVTVRPGMSLNQLRFLTDYGAKLTPAQILEETRNCPLLFMSSEKDAPAAPHHVTSEGLEFHLDLSGKSTEGIIGLLARHNPDPIDLSQSRTLKAEHYFEPIKGNRRLLLERGKYYLLSTVEDFRIPPHLNAEVQRSSISTWTGQLDFAGFLDNGFQGDLVLEPRSDEESTLMLQHGKPLGPLKIFYTAIPDKLYGKKTGAHYQEQRGPRTAKFFQPFDFAMAAKNYDKLSRIVLVNDALVLLQHNPGKGFLYLDPSREEGLLRHVEEGFFNSRYDCEDDERLLQIIPYVLIFGSNNSVFSYKRASKMRDYGDQRLFGRHSIRLGGHITQSDVPNYLERCIQREVLQEEVEVGDQYTAPRLMGTLMSYDTPVDRVHFGLIYAMHTQRDVRIKETSMTDGRMVSFSELQADPDKNKKFETWSKVLIPHLGEIYHKSKS